MVKAIGQSAHYEKKNLKEDAECRCINLFLEELQVIVARGCKHTQVVMSIKYSIMFHFLKHPDKSQYVFLQYLFFMFLWAKEDQIEPCSHPRWGET